MRKVFPFYILVDSSRCSKRYRNGWKHKISLFQNHCDIMIYHRAVCTHRHTHRVTTPSFLLQRWSALKVTYLKLADRSRLPFEFLCESIVMFPHLINSIHHQLPQTLILLTANPASAQQLESGAPLWPIVRSLCTHVWAHCRPERRHTLQHNNLLSYCGDSEYQIAG